MDRSSASPPWQALHVLTELARQGSYTATAARLRVSKAAVSQQIAALERQAGVPLVRRTTRSVQLTDAGRQLAEGVGAAYEEIARQFAGVRDLAAEPQGPLRVTAPVALAHQHLVPALPAFMHRHPAIHLELVLSDHLSSLASEGFDLAIRHTTSAPDTHVAWLLCNTRTVLVASPDFLRRHGQPDHPTALAQLPCLHYPRPRGALAWTFEAVASGERVTAPIQGVLAANNSEVLRELAEQGLGVALVPDFSAGDALARGALVPVMPAWRPVDTFGSRIYAIRPYAAQVPRTVQVFVAYLRSVFADGF